MKLIEKKRRTLAKAVLLFVMGVLVWGTGLYKVFALTYEKYIEIRFQGRVKETDQADTKNAVPQSMAGNGNTIYLLKNRENIDSSLDDRSYIVKILDANSNSPQLVLPRDAAYVGHGNGMTYYNGYLYVADGTRAKLYRVEEESQSTNKIQNPSTEWINKEGTLYFDKKTLTVSGVNSNEAIRNIAHYNGNYFIVCLKSSYSGTTNTLTYGVGLLNNMTFTIQKRFTVVASNSYSKVQDIDYCDGYIWAVLSDGANNNIHLIEIPSSYGEIENGKTYTIMKTVKINKNEAGRADTYNEMESVYVNGSNIYTWSNIREGWYETFCRYPRFPNGVTVTSVNTKSKTSLVINWNAVSYANKYRIDRKKDGGSWEKEIGIVDGSQTSFIDTDLTAGTKYYYRVYGRSSDGTYSPDPNSEGIKYGVTRTATPKVSSVAPISESELKVNWTAVTEAKKYIVCRKKENTGEGWEYYSRVAETTGTEYLDKGLEPNTTYYYGIIAVTETGVESGNPNDNANPGPENRMSGTTLEAIQIALNKTTLARTSGETYKLRATVTPAYAANSQINWTSSNSFVVSIDKDGNLVALQPGTAIITATEQMKNKTATCSVTVNAADLLELDKEQTILNGIYRIRLTETTQVLTVQGHSNEDGAEIYLLEETDDDEYQQFRFEYDQDGFYTVKNVGSGKYLQDMSTGIGPGTNIQQMERETGPAQLWQPVKKGSSYYLTPQSSTNLVIDVTYLGDNDISSNANLWIPKNGEYQLFELIPVSQEMNEADFVLPEETEEIRESAFEGVGARIVYIPDNCTSIGAYAFQNSSIKQIRIPADCEIGDDVFAGCEEVTVFGTAGSNSQAYCEEKDNLIFIEE